MRTVEYGAGSVRLIDQTLLPGELRYIECRDTDTLCEAIRMLRVRGAPAIGVAAAYGVVVAAERLVESGRPVGDMIDRLRNEIERLRSTRPTAVNLSWALDRMGTVLSGADTEQPENLIGALTLEADRIASEDDRANQAMGDLGAGLIPDGANILTHCNAGGLATGEFGTAVGVIVAAHRQGKRLHVWVDETRPLLQGARLTAWELQQEGVPYTLITDSMAAHFMARGEIDLAVVGADRVSANGDAANKIGTYGIATLAKAHDIPFYFAAPTSTVDLTTPDGGGIVIEQRDPSEVTSFHGVRTAPEGARAANPAFDVTPARLVSAIITETGIVYPPFSEGLRDAVQRALVCV